jgi:acyl transferase domain-containing protein/NADP-dependent 3-hydroxy acid dehydrogenase YdfG
LLDLAASVARESDREQPVQLAIVADSTAQLIETLRAIEEPGRKAKGLFWAEAEQTAGTVAFLFPGQGSQRAGMLRELALYFPEARASFAALGELNACVFPALGAQAGDAAQLRETGNAQPALGAADLALSDVLARFGVRATASAGHSYGELVALCHAGVVPREQLQPLSRARARAMLDALDGQPGAMTVVVAPSTVASALLEGVEGAWLANLNSPAQSVIAGELGAVEQVERRARAEGQRVKRLAVPYAFHTPRLRAAQTAFARALAQCELAPPSLPVFSNAEAAPYPDAASAIRQLLSRQLAEPVRFEAMVRRMYDAGARVFVEVGPSDVLTGLVRDILNGAPHLAVATDRAGRSGVRTLLEALAQLSVAGVTIDERRAFDGREPAALQLDAPPARTSAWRADGARVWNADQPAVSTAPVTLSLAAPPGAGADREGTMREYLELTRQLIESQREVMLAYLQPDGTAAPRAQRAEPGIRAATRPRAEPAPDAALPAESDASSAPLTPEACLKQLFAERTGYPVEMLSGTADLEAELGVDSIKRMEVLQLLLERVAPHAGDERERVVERLLKLRTIDAIVRELAHSAGNAAASAEPAPHEASSAAPSAAPSVDRTQQPQLSRLVPMPIALEPARAHEHDLRRVAVTAEAREIAEQVIADLRSLGIEASAIDTSEQLAGGFDALVCLSALDREDRDPAKRAFAFARAAADHGVRALLALSALGGALGLEPSAERGSGGVAGLIKSFAKEHEHMRCRVLDVALAEGKQRIADHVARELLAADDALEVGWREHARSTLRATPEARPSTPRVALGQDDVVLLVGGARGITAALALGLHERFGCRLALVGRSDPRFAEGYAPLGDVRDAACARRAVLASDGQLAANELERRARRLRGACECAQNLAQLERAGARFSYHALDITDRGAVHELIATITREHGRVDGVIHAAGVLEDGLVRHKQQAAFDRVYDTKVQGARNLLTELPAEVRFVLFFSSVAALYGNAGQTDYAAANDWLDVLARTTPACTQGPRLRSIAWGPWADVGMVSSELERVYRARGVELIDPQVGVAECIDEIVYGDRAHVALIAAPREGRS